MPAPVHVSEARTDGVGPRPLSARRLVRLTELMFVAACAVFVTVVLPAEHGIDPTGFGRMTGLSGSQAASPEAPRVAGEGASTLAASTQYYATPFRSHTVEIPLAAGDDCKRRCELEYKVRMKAGDSMVYSWSVQGVTDPQAFYFDFHGETPAGPGVPKPVDVAYRESTGTSSNGVLITAVPGLHGWYFQNQSPAPVVVRLSLSGFYELVPPGQNGNLAGITAKPPGRASQP